MPFPHFGSFDFLGDLLVSFIARFFPFPPFPALVGALETEGALLGRWLTLGDSLGSSEGTHEGVLDGILLVLGAALKEGKTEGKAEGEVDGLALGTDEGDTLGVKDGWPEGKADGFELGTDEGDTLDDGSGEKIVGAPTPLNANMYTPGEPSFVALHPVLPGA